MSTNPKNGTTEDAEHLNGPTRFQSVIPQKRQELLKWNGWGYKDSEFRVNERKILEFTGTRYPIGSKELPYFTQWVQDVLGVDVANRNVSQPMPTDLPEPVISSELLDAIQELKIEYSTKGIDRLVRAHGHTLREIYILKHGSFKRIPDVVLWPKCHEDVVKIVKLCARYGVVCIPFGGGTSVSGASSCPVNERRTIVLLDTSQMNRILWIDRENLVACCESGIIGQDLEKQLRLQGLTSGHEPDSYEFSSLGGWVATRASGMKKNRYGNIEDLVIRVRMVTGRTEDPEITLERNILVPRASCGPDFDHMILGSEGTLGVVTEVVLKIRPLPKVVKYGSVVFPNFQTGVEAMRQDAFTLIDIYITDRPGHDLFLSDVLSVIKRKELIILSYEQVAKERCQPTSIRLMDNEQFQFGQMLRPESGWGGLILQGLKQAYITRIKGFKWDQICVATLLFEGSSTADVTAQEQKIYTIARQHGGVPAGETNGERGYVLTFVIAYIRDLGLEYYVLAESFETSVSWNRALPLCRNVKSRVSRECYARNIEQFFISCRITQTYDAGCCVYFYMALNYSNLKDPVETYEAIEHAAREEILANGGSLSHHHGVGKLRACFYTDTVGEVGISLYRAAKVHLDPHNVFAAGNLDPKCTSKL